VTVKFYRLMQFL